MISRPAAGAAALAMAACVSVPAPQPLPELAAQPPAFEMTGRLAVRVADRSEIARLRWTHRPASDVWVLASPLGNEVARIESDEAGATLAQAGAPPQRAASFSVLTARLLGVPLEPATLAAWLHGGEPASPAADWKVTIEERQRAGAIELARRMSATRGEVVVRLVVDEYRELRD